MSNKIIFLTLITFAIIFEVIGDVFFKQWSTNQKLWSLLIGLAIYAIGTIFWAISIKYELLSSAISIFTVLNLISVVLIGVLFFKESLSPVNYLGIVLGVMSIVLLEL